MNVLSLFDGISCGHLALQRAGIKVDKYYASEIDKKAISVTQYHFPETIQLGDVRNIIGSQLPKIDLLIGGSPCTGFSNAGKGLNFNDPQSKLFFEFVRLRDELKPKYFLLENVKMKKEWLDTISQYMGVKPVFINSKLVSAQYRQRYYWTNISDSIEQPKDKGIMLGDIIYDDTYKVFTDSKIEASKRITKGEIGYVQWDKNNTGYSSMTARAHFKNKKISALTTNAYMNIVLDYDKGIYRRLHPIEAERLQTVPDNYTNVNGLSDSQRIKMLGNGWTVDVVAHIFKYIKEKEND